MKQNNLTERFLTQVMSAITYDDKLKDEVIFRLIDEGSACANGLLSAYLKKMGELHDICNLTLKVEFDLESYDETKFIRITYPEGRRVLRTYIVCQFDPDTGFSNLRYYYTQKHCGNDNKLLVINAHGEIYECCKLFHDNTNEEDKAVFRDYFSHLGYQVA